MTFHGFDSLHSFTASYQIHRNEQNTNSPRLASFPTRDGCHYTLFKAKIESLACFYNLNGSSSFLMGNRPQSTNLNRAAINNEKSKENIRGGSIDIFITDLSSIHGQTPKLNFLVPREGKDTMTHNNTFTTPTSLIWSEKWLL